MIEKIKGLLPLDIYQELETILKTRQISASQLSHILGNCHHECQWSKYEEGLNYKPERLLLGTSYMEVEWEIAQQKDIHTEVVDACN